MKVCILAAGVGSRMKHFSDAVHKSLLPLGNQAVLSRIIGQFPTDTHFVFAVAYRAQQIKDYLKLAHPELQSTFVQISNYQDKGSGPGLSLYCCREHLQEPFVFTASDTLIEGDLPQCSTNWLGVAKVTSVAEWCSVSLNRSGQVTDIYYKEERDTPWAFVGIAGIYDFDTFWRGFATNESLVGGELQVNNGLEALVPLGLKAESLVWSDTGSESAYQRCLDKFEKNFTFSGKKNELTYKVESRVIKFLGEESQAENRFLRARDYPGAFPQPIACEGNFFCYEFEHGKILSSCLSFTEVKSFLNWAESKLWRELSFESDKTAALCRSFYLDKTKQRLQRYFSSYSIGEEEDAVLIDGLLCRSTTALLEALPNSFFETGLASTYHGDLHADNVIKTDSGYKLIDWRQSFAESVEVGDRYYDLAKFMHTLVLSVDAMEREEYQILRDDHEYRLEHHCSSSQIAAMDAFREFVEENGYDMQRIEIINGLIFLNMAPLYDYSMAEYLYFLGRYRLQKVLEDSGFVSC